VSSYRNSIKRTRIDEILGAEGLRRRTRETWSGERVDPAFAENKGAIVALYTAPPAGRAVICLAERSSSRSTTAMPIISAMPSPYSSAMMFRRRCLWLPASSADSGSSDGMSWKGSCCSRARCLR
jgi:hypothetical protein